MVMHPRRNHLEGCASPRRKPRPKKQPRVGRNARFSHAVLKTEHNGAEYTVLIPPGIRYGGRMMQHIPPDAATRHHPNVTILDFISSNRNAELTGSEGRRPLLSSEVIGCARVLFIKKAKDPNQRINTHSHNQNYKNRKQNVCFPFAPH
jgi:hypothetical protein